MNSWFDDLVDEALPVSCSPVERQTTPRALPMSVRADVEGGAAPTTYRDPCKKCHGRGRFVSYSGRTLGNCFACKGAGSFERKTAPEVRGRARAAQTARKARTVQEYREFFASLHPIVWAWIEESRERFDFAGAMFEAIGKYGELTENQMAACERSIAKRDAARAERTDRIENAPTVETDKLMEAFDKAKGNGLKAPKLRFALFNASLAKDGSKNAGAVYLKAGETYLGKIQAGKYIASRDASPDQRAAVVETMADPVAAAVAYGRRTGNCACCGRELENKESIERGIGPVCADKYFG